jgi:mannose-6-phosphate isomerase-like protein (cupin superfamily)
MEITNPKVQCVDPAAFADCRGISYICDNPGAACEEDGLPILRSQIEDVNLGLYRGLAQAMEKIGKEQPLANHGVCVTPAWSYHVTIQDLIHYGNIHLIRQPERNVFEGVFARLPASVVAPLPMQFPPTTLPLPGRWKIRFRVSGIAVLPGQAALLARLAPVDEESERSMTQIEQRRRDLDGQFAAIGKPPNPEWAPHITLGYFANPELALAAAAHVERWSEAAAICTLGRIIEFGSISLYAFTTMDKFWRFPMPAVLLRSREIEAARRDPRTYLGNRGDQKVVITYRYTGDEGLRDVIWTALAPNGKRHYAVAAGVEFALFDERAKQSRHYHRRATEVYTVLEGEMCIEVAGAEYSLTVGESIIVNPWSAHEVKRTARFLAQVVTANSSGLNDKYIVE